jgi:hypothetical protein
MIRRIRMARKRLSVARERVASLDRTADRKLNDENYNGRQVGGAFWRAGVARWNLEAIEGQGAPR